MSHWYKSEDGAPMYTIIGANGKERDTTLRDARKLNLYPSTTTVMGVQDKPQLTEWIINQVMEAAIRTPYEKKMAVDKWKRYIREQSKEVGQKASKRGTEVHDALEQYYTKGTIKASEKALVVPVIEFMEENFPGVKWVSEASFSHPAGFGGKVDMYSNDGSGYVLDFKTKDVPDTTKMVAYDDHGIQTASYVMGLSEGNESKLSQGELHDMSAVKRYNLFISTQVPGVMKLTESKDWDRDSNLFMSLLRFWQVKNKYMA